AELLSGLESIVAELLTDVDSILSDALDAATLQANVELCILGSDGCSGGLATGIHLNIPSQQLGDILTDDELNLTLAVYLGGVNVTGDIDLGALASGIVGAIRDLLFDDTEGVLALVSGPLD